MACKSASRPTSPAGIEYHGVAGSTHDCEAAVLRLLICGSVIAKALVLTAGRDHALLLTTGIGDPIAIKKGFSSGYHGTGPRGLSRVLQLLDSYSVELDECEVSEDLMERLDRSALRHRDLAEIEALPPIRPTRLYDYIFDKDEAAARDGTLWRNLPPVIPFSVMEARLMDLVLRFQTAPDDCLNKGYRRLEDHIRKRTGLKEFGVKLLSATFLGKNAVLTWDLNDEAEIVGRANLFTGAFMAFRNG